MNRSVEMKIRRRRENDTITGNIFKLTENSTGRFKIVAAENLLATSITRRVFNIDGIKRLNVSPYILVDKIIRNISISEIALSNCNIDEVLYHLIRNEMVRISLELQSSVDEHEIDKIMETLSPDIDTCSALLRNINE